MTTAAPSVGAELDPEVQEFVEQSRAFASARLRLRMQRGALAIAAAFAAVVALLAVLAPSDRAPSLGTILLLVASYALASRVEFEVRTALALPTELVLVPMLFLVPLHDVPIFVAGGLLLGRTPDFLRGRVPMDPALLIAPNAGTPSVPWSCSRSPASARRASTSGPSTSPPSPRSSSSSSRAQHRSIGT
jgi:hypothetical protein